MNKLEDFIMLLPEAVSKSDCAKTVDELENAVFNKVGCEGCTTDCDTLLLGREEAVSTNQIIMDAIWTSVQQYVKKHGVSREWKSWEGFTNIKWNKYVEGKSMDTHIDHIHDIFENVVGTPKGIPILSIVGVLNDEYTGGEFEMFDDTKIKLKTGDLLLFPSNFLYPHRVLPVTKGVRHSYVSWVY